MAAQLTLTTPLGQNAFLVDGFSGREDLSCPYSFDLDLVAPSGQPVSFDALLGQPFTLAYSPPGQAPRYFSGICSRLSQGARYDDGTTRFRAEVVPQVWLLTKTHDSRVFQHLSVPEILQHVLGNDPQYVIEGTFQPRNYCVQYRESDWDFASRLMEEEGIYYFFTHSADGHQMVIANSPQGHPDLSGTVAFDPTGDSSGVGVWTKTQTLTASKVELWDHNFELPTNDLETSADIQESATAGQVTHSLELGPNADLEQYDFPGGYAKRFDGVDAGGGAQPSQLQKIFPDADRTSAIRMQAEAVAALEIHGASRTPGLTAGHRFALGGHFDADGQYVLTSVQHDATCADPNGGSVYYTNAFSCIPSSLPFRPQRTTARPVIGGAQTAYVVGPAGEDHFVDRYGRVKVQFHWDREGRKDQNSSCWIRVVQPPGTFATPLIGQEVVIDFLEGDPDQPLITGRVRNASDPPPPP